MHYVPKTYLKHFAREDATKGKPEYFISSIDKVTGKFKEINIVNLCVDKDIYRVNGKTEEERQVLEDMYRIMFEDGYDDLYRILTNDNIIFMTQSQRDSIINFVVSMFYRNKVWNDIYQHFMDGLFEKAFNVSKKNGQTSFFIEDEEISIEGKSLDDLKREYRKKDGPMGAMTSAHKIFQHARLRRIQDVISVTKLKCEHEYITSDHPVVCRNTPGIHTIPMDPDNRLSIAISNKYLLELIPMKDDEINFLMIGRMPTTSFMGSLSSATHNDAQIGQSDKFLFGSSNTIKGFKVKT